MVKNHLVFLRVFTSLLLSDWLYDKVILLESSEEESETDSDDESDEDSSDNSEESSEQESDNGM